MKHMVILLILGLAGLPALLLIETAAVMCSKVVSGSTSDVVVLVGLLAGVSVHFLLRRSSRYEFLDTFQHEMSHLLVGMLLWAEPKSFVVEPNSRAESRGRSLGHVSYSMSRRGQSVRSFVVSLAPYWLSPLALVPLLVCGLQPTLPFIGRFFVMAVAGLALALPLTQFHPGQRDLLKHWFYAPVAVALWLWAAQAVILLTSLDSWSLAGTIDLYRLAWNRIW